MKHFLLNIILFCLVLLGTYFFFINKLSNGIVDENYYKFTKEAGGLIIGQSRANQGIDPKIIEEKLSNRGFNFPIVNFAFDGYQSFYGKVYLNAIKEKIKKGNKNGLFIISVNPGSFSVQKNMKNDSLLQMDDNLMLSKLTSFKSNPNYNYLINYYSNSLYNTLLKEDGPSNLIVHKNGWKELKQETKSNSFKESDIKQWKNETINNYSKLIKTKAVNKTRYNYLIETIIYLKQKGEVFLVRIPTDNDITDLENNNWKKFNQEFDSISNSHNIHFLDYSDLKVKTYDGSHLFSESAKKFTNILTDDIKAYLSDSEKK